MIYDILGHRAPGACSSRTWRSSHVYRTEYREVVVFSHLSDGRTHRLDLL